MVLAEILGGLEVRGEGRFREARGKEGFSDEGKRI